jgi:hypothetical protein
LTNSAGSFLTSKIFAMAKAVKTKKAVKGIVGKAQKNEGSIEAATRGFSNNLIPEDNLDRKQNSKGLERKKAVFKKKAAKTSGIAERGIAMANDVPPTEPDDENEAMEE